MDLGFIKVAAGIPDLKVSDCEYNTSRILEQIKKAVEKDVQIICFPELCITSYSCGDLFYQHILIESAEKSLSKLLSLTKEHSIVCIVGLPVNKENKLYNCAAIFQKGLIKALIPKTYIPNNKGYCETRWFSPSYTAKNNIINICGQEVPFGPNILLEYGKTFIGIEISEDLWAPIPPSSYHCLNGADIIFNLSASNEITGKNKYRVNLIKQQSAKCICGYVYASAGNGESTTDSVFTGNAFITENGLMLSQSERFCDEEQLIITEIDVLSLLSDRKKSIFFRTLPSNATDEEPNYRIVNLNYQEYDFERITRYINPYPFIPQNEEEIDDSCKEIFSIQIAGLSKRLKHIDSKHAIIGISGGLDSTLALLVTANTFDKLNLPRKNIIGITMPGFGTSDRTYNNAINLMKSLDVTIKEIDIKDACIKHFKDIGHDPDIKDVTYENTQARERTQILMDIANKMCGIVIGTGDMSELALGWATYNGDHMSMYGVNSGVPKTLVRFLVKWAGNNVVNILTKKILLDILDTPVSPELLPTDENNEINQKTEEIVGPYELHDFFLYYMIRFGFEPKKVLFLAEVAFKDLYNSDTIKKWLRIFYKRFFTQQFKRSCMPDGPKVGSINLSPRGDWHMPSDASFELWVKQTDGKS
jgi:NAD+ synthase (glutamine-hydrolysing)